MEMDLPMNAENIVVHFLSFVAWISMAFFLAGYRRSFLELSEGLRSFRLTGSLKTVEKPSLALKSVAKSLGIAVHERNTASDEEDRTLDLASLVKFLFLLKCDRLEIEHDAKDNKISLLMPTGVGLPATLVELEDPYFKVKVVG